MPPQAIEREYRALHDNLLAEVAVAGVVAVGGSLHCEACKERDTISLGSDAAPRISAHPVQKYCYLQAWIFTDGSSTLTQTPTLSLEVFDLGTSWLEKCKRQRYRSAATAHARNQCFGHPKAASASLDPIKMKVPARTYWPLRASRPGRRPGSAWTPLQRSL